MRARRLRRRTAMPAATSCWPVMRLCCTGMTSTRAACRSLPAHTAPLIAATSGRVRGTPESVDRSPLNPPNDLVRSYAGEPPERRGVLHGHVDPVVNETGHHCNLPSDGIAIPAHAPELTPRQDVVVRQRPEAGDRHPRDHGAIMSNPDKSAAKLSTGTPIGGIAARILRRFYLDPAWSRARIMAISSGPSASLTTRIGRRLSVGRNPKLLAKATARPLSVPTQ